MRRKPGQASGAAMIRSSQWTRATVTAWLSVFILVVPPVHAETVPQRLSDWLLAHPPAADDYPLGLSWRVPGEMAAQERLRADLLKSLSGDDREVKAAPQALSRLHEWIATLPVTGRVPVAAADARWLQVNPERDPVLQAGQSVVLPARPRTVTVVTAMGKRCAIGHVAGRRAMDYVHACEPLRMKQTDWAWVVQPDGKIQRFGVASWNLETQDEPAPGAWIWAPSRDGGWPERLSQRLTAFLATQGPASDAVADEKSDAAPSASATPPRGMKVTSSDWGSVGLLQTPTARMRPPGDLAFDLSRIPPYTTMNVFLQPFEWMELGFRYASLSNALYGPSIAGEQAYKDKSVDVKFRLNEESAVLPQVAFGMRDITGTGLFSGEYLVANKRNDDFDWSLGLGWGYLGARGNLHNPLGYISPAFDTRDAVVAGQGGNFDLRHYFRGRAALFGGVQYQTPWAPLMLKLEYEGNDYQHEPFGNNLVQSSPWNFGLVYQAADSVDISLGVERGNTAMLGITLHTSLGSMSMPKLADPPRIAVAPERPQQAPDWAATGQELKRQTDWPVRSIEQDDRDLRVTFDDVEAGYWRDRMDRAISVLHRDAPASVDSFTLDYRRDGMDMAEQRVDRDAWVEQRTQALPSGAQREAVIDQVPSRPAETNLLYHGERSPLDTKLGMDLNYNLGGPDGFILYQFAATGKAKLRFDDDTWLQGGVQLGVLDNYDKFKYDAPSNLQRVRTYLREYKTASEFTMPNLQLTHTGKLSENNYYSLYGGYLESMFAGVGGEWLYRPFQGSQAFGVNVNAVQQRDFRQDFGFLNRDGLPNYRVVTGHASWYWDTGWNDVQTTVSVGRYLAKDVGATFGVSRAFRNGVKMGVGFTKTNLSAAQFGEGSFDKWMYVSIPFDAMLMRSSGSNANFIWKPLIRDGGAMLDRAVTLYDVTTVRDERATHYEPAPLPAEMSAPEARFGDDYDQPRVIEPYTYVAPKVDAAQWTAQAQRYRQRLEEALYRQRFRDIRIDFDRSYRLQLSLSNDDIRPVSRAVGRAVRTALLNAPLDAREIRITFLQRGTPPVPVVTYDFIDLPRLQRYLDGEIGESELANSVAVEYLSPSVQRNDPLAQLGDTEPIVEGRSFLEAFAPDPNPLYRVRDDLLNAGRYAAGTDWLKVGLAGSGLVLASAILDKRDDDYVTQHAQDHWLKTANNLGNVAVPLLAFTGAATAAFASSDPVLSRTGYASLEAGGVALAVSTGLGYAVGRARPDAGLGRAHFQPFSGSTSTGSFPSDHTMFVWALATPFAEEYDAPWLYGAAAVTNLARVGSRRHWVSDTMAGSLLGYGIGRIFWESSRAPNNGAYPRIGVSGRGVTLNWNMQ